MRLLEITNDFPPTLGGIENYIYSLMARWESGNAVVLTRCREGSECIDRSLPLPVHREPVSTLLPTRHLWARVEHLLASGHFDLVHFASPLPLALFGPRIRRRWGIPYAVSVHGGEFIAGVRLARPLMQRALGQAAVALPVSSFTQEAIRRWLPEPPPTEVVTPGVDPCRFAPSAERFADPAMDVGEGGCVILSVGRLIARKGFATLIAAMPAVLARHPATVLAIIGDGPDRQRLERLAASVRVGAAVRFLGPRPWSHLGGYYAAAEIFALPTRERFGGLETEGFPLVYLEAAASGLPTVAGRAGGVGEAVADGVTGLIVDGRIPNQSADALIRLLDAPVLARSMGTAGRERVIDRFSWEQVGQRFATALAKHAR